MFPFLVFPGSFPLNPVTVFITLTKTVNKQKKKETTFIIYKGSQAQREASAGDEAMDLPFQAGFIYSNSTT